MTTSSKYLKEILLVNLFIANVFISSITTYTSSSFFIKTIAAIALWSIIITDIKISKFDFTEHIKTKYFKRLLIILSLFILILLISLSYSYNPSFGFQKLLSLTISTLPTILAFLYLLLTLNKERYYTFIFSIIIISILSVVLILIIEPFSYDGSTGKSLTTWSHVIYGRFISFVYIIILFYLLNLKSKKLIPTVSLFLSVIILGVYLSGLRAALIGIIVFTILILIIYLIQKKLNVINIAFLIASIVISFLTINILSTNDKILTERFNNLQDFKELRFNYDSPIHTRYNSFDVCIEIIKEKPLLGVGFGGFRDFGGNYFTNAMKYPHNIFLEFAVELGIPGVLLLLFLLYIIFSSARKVSIEVFIFFLFALWLAMFSKDIPSQSLLWIGLGFYGMKDSRLSIDY